MESQAGAVHWCGMNLPARVAALSITALALARCGGGGAAAQRRWVMWQALEKFHRWVLALALTAMAFVGNYSVARSVELQDWGANQYAGRARLLPWALPALALSVLTMKYGRAASVQPTALIEATATTATAAEATGKATEEPLQAWGGVLASRRGGWYMLWAQTIAMLFLHLLQVGRAYNIPP